MKVISDSKFDRSYTMRKTNSDENIFDFHRFLRDIWKESKPICKLFRTNTTGYIYDTGTNKILGCNDLEYSFLNKLLSLPIDKAINKMRLECSNDQFPKISQNIKDAIEKEKILLTNKSTQFGLSAHYHNLEELLNNSLGLIQLEVTEQCNLLCEYCVFNPNFTTKRNHGTRNMSLNTAYSAIDYLVDHSKGKDRMTIVFYGGEPLLRYPFIKSCVNYAKNKAKNKNCSFSITTNGTLLNSNIVAFLFKNNFGVCVSIDGPEDIHNTYRRFVNGKGSFKHVLPKLKMLLDAYGDKSTNKISFSMVYAPPYSEKKIERIIELWDENLWIPKDIRVNITYPSEGSFPRIRFSSVDLTEDKSLGLWAQEKFLANYIGSCKGIPIVKGIIEKKMAMLLQRQIFNEPTGKYHLNGCCIPGVRKIYVSTNGEFHLCERIDTDAPIIGNVFSGIKIERVKEIYIDEYEKESLPFCSSCWAIRLCPVCYVAAFKNGIIDAKKKSNNCINAIFSKEQDLKFLCKLLEQNSEGLNYLGDWKFE